MKKYLKFGLFLLLLWGTIATILAQEDIITYHFKKGEVLDVLLLTNGPDVQTLLPRYRETAFPVAATFSYKPVPGFPIKETVQGGVQPQSIIFGKWESLDKREGFLKAIVPAVPDFHEQRRALWPYFTLTYYEVKEDTDLVIDRSKYNVVTSYWGKGKAFTAYLEVFKKDTKEQGGKEVLTLTRGNSPVGYMYNPEYLTITQWNNKEAFDLFYEKHQAMEESQITNVHQFILN